MSSKTFQSRRKASLGRSAFIEVEPNVRLHITDMGAGQPVVLIPGYPFGAAMYEYTIHALVAAGYRAIGVDTRGFGLSDKPEGGYNYDVFADDLKVVMETLGLENAVLGGHSMGGAYSLHFAAKYGGEHLSGLALFSAAAPKHTKAADYPYPLFTKEDISSWLELLKVNRPALTDTVGERFVLPTNTLTPGYFAWLGSLGVTASPYAMVKALTALRDEDLREDLAKIKVPTLILHAKDDAIAAYALAEQMHAGIKNATLVTFDKSGHGTFIEEREKFNAELLKFLKR
ncbi:alpha/beta fold hydrolase [Chitinophaga parva]|nr:alpha/beta hydrolase [Chitinophaga parva]